MPNRKANEKKKENFIDEYLTDMEQKLKEDTSGLVERLEVMREEVSQYTFQPQEFMIMADAFLTFYKMDEETQKKYIMGSLTVKMDIISKIRDLESPELIVDRAMNVGDILFYSYKASGSSIYNYAIHRMLYVLTGEDALLTPLGLSLYRMPMTMRRPKHPETNPEGMYH